MGYDIAGRGAFIASVMFFLTSAHDPILKKMINNKMSVIWGLLLLYHFVNAWIKHVPVRDVFLLFISMFDLYTMLILSGFLYLKNEQKALKSFVWGCALFVIMGFATGVSMGEGGRLTNAGDFVSHININQFAPVVGFFLLFFVYYAFLTRKSLSFTILIAIAPIIVIVLAGSRNGLLFLLAFMISLIFGPLAGKRVSFMRIFVTIVGVAIIWLGYDYILDNTVLGERIQYTTEQAERSDLETGIGILDAMGDRGIFYVKGWSDFLSHPFTGIGYNNFANVHRESLGLSLHTEYMIHLAEGGLIASVLYIFFYFLLIKNLWKIWSVEHVSTLFVLLCSVFVYLLVGLTAREFMYIQFYPMMGLWIATIIKKR